MGLHQAGFDVTGVDIEPQPRYPFKFIQADALTFPLEGYDFIWASPPCQRYSIATQCQPGLAEQYPDLIDPIRMRLQATGLPYAIENVEGAFSRLRNPTLLCGVMFGLDMYRHRLFETSYEVGLILHPNHLVVCSRAMRTMGLGCGWMVGFRAMTSLSPWTIRGAITQCFIQNSAKKFKEGKQYAS